MHPLKTLGELGQAVWLDDIHRQLIRSGQLKRWIDEDGLRGMTSNPAIFNKAIADSSEYDDLIRELRARDLPAGEVAETIMVRDVQAAADVFRPLFESTGGRHGYVSLEVNPNLARDTEGTVTEARRLWKALDRPNVFVKVPGTREGLVAIERLIAEGINVNVTLLFGLPRYQEVHRAYIAGIEKRVERGEDVRRVRSVASFFLSRIDVLLDPRFENISREGGETGELAAKLRGEVAIASAKMAYQMYKETLGSARWQRLAAGGAHPQHLLWASTSTKNPDYSDVKYVEPLIGPDTINTLPQETFEAYRDHGRPRLTLEENLEHSRWVLQQLPRLGISIDEATEQLEEEGIDKFKKPYGKLLETLERELQAA